MNNGINHEAFLADVYPLLKELNKLLKTYGYQHIVTCYADANGYLGISGRDGIEYWELPSGYSSKDWENSSLAKEVC